MVILTSQEMKELEVHAMNKYHIPGLLLMEHAGTAVVDEITRLYNAQTKIAIVCGRGNNGGDGFVIARQLIMLSYKVTVIVVGSSDLRGDALTNYNILKSMSEISYVERMSDIDEIEADVIVDALFGTGLDRPLKGIYLEMVHKINESSSHVISVDIPSGIDGSTGHVMGVAVIANKTISFETYKIGHMVYPGAGYCGELLLAPIGIPRDSYRSFDHSCHLITEETVRSLMPKRKPDSHKGTFGHGAVIAGSKGMEGAAILLTSAAMRTGMGLLSLHMLEDFNHIIKPVVPEILTKTYSLESLSGADVIAIGSGSGQGGDFKKCLREVLLNMDCPFVVDADGINVLSSKLSMLNGNRVVLTPHIKEMSRLTKLSVDEILSDTIGVSRRFATEHGVTVVLKSARTVIALPDGNVYINCKGNSGMATGGTGDVLTGIITSLIAQGLTSEEAAILGVYFHGKAGDMVKASIGEHGLLASDMVEMIPTVLKDLSSE